eukprot:4864066-Amphidinium_carterae.7
MSSKKLVAPVFTNAQASPYGVCSTCQQRLRCFCLDLEHADTGPWERQCNAIEAGSQDNVAQTACLPCAHAYPPVVSSTIRHSSLPIFQRQRGLLGTSCTQVLRAAGFLMFPRHGLQIDSQASSASWHSLSHKRKRTCLSSEGPLG